MSSKILIAGCGYLGTAFGREAAAEGAEVWGVRRDIATAASLTKAGIRPLFGDLTDQAFLKKLPVVNVVLFCASPSRPSDSYGKTYLEAARNLTGHLWGSSLKRFIFISSTSVYSTNDGSWVDEKTDPLRPGHSDPAAGEHAKTLLETEREVLESGLSATVFRLAGFYGPGRNRIRPILEGKFKPALSDLYTNRIHLEDAVNGIKLLSEKGRPGEIYLGADDAPSTQREFYTWLYGKLGRPLPEGGTDRMHSGGSNKRCWNGKIKKLGLKLKYPSYKEGYAALLAAAAERRS